MTNAFRRIVRTKAAAALVVSLLGSNGCNASPTEERQAAVPPADGPPAKAAQEAPVNPEEAHVREIDFGIADGEYWTDPTRTRKTVVQELWKAKRDAMAIGAPRTVPLDLRETLPLVIYRGAPYRDLWAMKMEGRAQVVAVDPARNRAYLGAVRVDENPEPEPPRDPAQAPKGDGSESAVLDLRESLGLPWEPATLLVTVLLRDFASNTVKVELGKSPGGFHDEEVAKFLAAEAKKTHPSGASPPTGEPLPNYTRIEGSPVTPATPGIALTADRVVVMKPGQASVVRGAFRLPVRQHERAAPGAAAGAPTAFVGITLVVTAGDEAGCTALRIDAPTWDRLTEADPVATGCFALDLRAAGMVPDRPQTYFVWAFADEHRAGPVPAALVSEKMLPGR